MYTKKRKKVNKDTWVVMPTYNEELTIDIAIRDVLMHCKNLVVVDDGSTDKTYSIAFGSCYVLKQVINKGKGAALRMGIEFAISKGAKKIIFIDADRQHEATKIPQFIKELDEKDIVFGFRNLTGQMPWKFRVGNYVLSQMINVLFKVRIIDSQCGFRAIRAEVYDKIKWHSDRYSVETEMIVNTAKHKLSYTQVPIRTIYLDSQKGTTVMDGVKIMYDILRFWWEEKSAK